MIRKCMMPLAVTFVLLVTLPARIARGDLARDITAVLQDKSLSKADVGIEVIRLGSSPSDAKVVFRHDSDIPFTPASNLKVITTSAFLDRLGSDFKFRTTLVFHNGDLHLWGDGDPTLGDAEMLRKVGWDVNTVFKAWAEQLKKRNITAVRNVYVDDSVFDTQFFHPHWPTNQEHKRYEAQVGGVNLNANCIDFLVQPSSGRVVSYSTDPVTDYITVRNTCITGDRNAIGLARQPGTNDVVLRGEAPSNYSTPVSVTIHDPPLFAATVLSETLASSGIKITGRVGRDRASRSTFDKATGKERESWFPIAIHETPISAVIARANKDSMNLYAEALCKRLGRAVTNSPGTWENGTAAVSAFLKSAGVPDPQFHLDDGCGLSHDNTISPAAIVKVLQYDFHSKNNDTFRASLSVAGADGTLEDRFRNSDLRHRVFGKSGFVSGVSCLSGYLHAKDDRWYAFSIMMNGIPEGTNSGMKVFQEKIVKAIDAHAAAGLASGR